MTATDGRRTAPSSSPETSGRRSVTTSFSTGSISRFARRVRRPAGPQRLGQVHLSAGARRTGRRFEGHVRYPSAAPSCSRIRDCCRGNAC